jgi:hypothetical protein
MREIISFSQPCYSSPLLYFLIGIKIKLRSPRQCESIFISISFISENRRGGKPDEQFITHTLEVEIRKAKQSSRLSRYELEFTLTSWIQSKLLSRKFELDDELSLFMIYFVLLENLQKKMKEGKLNSEGLSSGLCDSIETSNQK